MNVSQFCPLIPGLIIRRSVDKSVSNFFYIPNTRHLQMQSKPPNIVIYAGNDVPKYETLKQKIEAVVLPNCYTTARLTDQGLKEHPWQSNTKLLIISGEISGNESIVTSYFNRGGDVLSAQSNVVHSLPLTCQSMEGVSHGVFFKLFSHPAGGKIIFTEDLLGRVDALIYFLSQVFSVSCVDSSKDRTETVQSSEAFLLGESEQLADFLASMGYTSNKTSITRGPYSLNFSPETIKVGELTKNLHVLLGKESPSFNSEEYFKILTTTSVGRVVLSAEVLESTHDIVENGIPYGGWVVVAGQQTKGKGRGANQWLSPEGCALFSVQLKVTLSSVLGLHLPLVQHVAALAVTLAAKRLPGCEHLSLGIKWPNDFYGGKTKLGGILVTSSIFGQEAVVNIGCGINLNNSKPTGCLNDLREKSSASKLSREEFIALVLNHLEELVHRMNTGRLNEVLELYKENWLHSNANVTISRDGRSREAVIVGIDEYGFLQTRLRSGDIITVQPDGNSFDMLSGLIAPKM